MIGQVIKTTKVNGVWTFDDTLLGIYNGEFCNGSDVVLDHSCKYVKNKDVCWVLFSQQEIPEIGKLSMKVVEVIGNKVYYETKVDNNPMRLLFYKKVLNAYFNDVPDKIYYKIY
tara:strand:- start:4355 stop:4696 length:342 start_codon:yes stop_codon:yes gene_type:complete